MVTAELLRLLTGLDPVSYLIGLSTPLVVTVLLGIVNRLPTKLIIRLLERRDATVKWTNDVHAAIIQARGEVDVWIDQGGAEVPEPIRSTMEQLRELHGQTDHPQVDPPKHVNDELQYTIQAYQDAREDPSSRGARHALMDQLDELEAAVSDEQ